MISRSRLRSFGRFIPAATTLVVLLVLLPGESSPFHTPKRWVLALGAGLGLLFSTPRWRWAALPWLVLGALQPGSGLQVLAFATALFAWPGLLPPPRASIRAAVLGAAIVALVVILQSLGADPFAWAHPDAGVRLSLYGTLGNPDFVASCLLPIALLCLSEKGRIWLVPLAIISVALALTRSFGTVLALAAGATLLLIHPVSRTRPRQLLPVLFLLLALAVPLLGRHFGNTAAGRHYLVTIAAPHVVEAPWWGHGIDSTVRLWPDWELQWWQQRCADAACVSAHPDGRFTGRQDHIHNDWLELLLERGILGLAALLLTLFGPFKAAWRRRDAHGPFILAALAALLARAFIDFPFARPADLCLLALLASLALAPPDLEPP